MASTPQNPPPSGIVSVTRPTITVPFGSYGQNQWAFWYLNGAPNIDEYTVSATLTGNPNYTGTIITKSWFGVDKATKVSFNPTNASSTTITSNAASDSTTYDVSVKFSIDGLNSDKLWIHINTPVSLYTNSISDQGHPSGCSGYLTRFEYIGVDLWNYALTKITTNETFDADIPGPNPPTAGWPANAPDAWTPDKWATNSTFVDSLYAYDCQGTWQPQPVTPRGLNSLVKSVPQKLYMGSATNGNGKLVKSATQDFYTDHANVR